jgi:mono/diheme cytochrome c family protein
MSRRAGRYGPLRCCQIDPMPIFVGSHTPSTSWPGPSRPSAPGSPGSRKEEGGARDARRHDTAATWFRRATFGCGALFLLCATASAEEFSPERVRAGAAIYSRNCSPCHGSRMQNPESAFDLRKFLPDQHERFVSSVTRGKNQMPPWGDLLSAEDIEALWAYVIAGEPR